MSLLVVAPHPDDECLGAGGTIIRAAERGDQVTVLTVCADLPPVYPEGVQALVQAEATRAHELLGVTTSVFLDFPSVEVSRLPVATVNAAVLEAVEAARPTTVLLPFPDRHVDHRAVFEAVMVATRPVAAGRDIQLVAMYETLSETFWNAPGAEALFSPNWTVDVSDVIDQKVKAYGEYHSQVSPYPGPRSLEAVRALALFRGSQAGMGFGEAFQIVRSTLPLPAPGASR